MHKWWLESMDKWVIDNLKLHDKKYRIIQSLKQDLLAK